MPIELTVQKIAGNLVPATEADKEAIASVKTGKAFRVELIQVSARSLKHHKLYFGGLLELAMDYWEPKGGLLAPSEIATLKKFSKWLDARSGNSGAIHGAAKAFLVELRERRALTIESPEKSKKDLHDWVKEQTGYYDLVIMPSGVKKKVRSINFNSMGQDEFMVFYKKAFSVVWKFILSRTFESEAQVENVICQLTDMS